MLSGVKATLGLGIRDLSPAYFALVMATGVISIVSHLFGMTSIATILFSLNCMFYVILVALFILRFIFYRKQFLSDFVDHIHGAGFFTAIAGTCVLGSQFVVLNNNVGLAKILLGIAIVLWLVIIYAFFAGITIRRKKPTLENGISGIWLTSVVATQSVSILSALVSASCGEGKQFVLFLALSLFCAGGMLYIMIITLIFYRLTFFRMEAEQFAPPYWINMGALAISTLASSDLVLRKDHWTLLAEITPVLKTMTLLFWAVGTWWIPLIVILGMWRHFGGQLPLKYHPQYWGMVFPMGMYTLATLRLVEVIGVPFLSKYSMVFGYAAMTAWILVFAGMLRHIIKMFMADTADTVA